MRALKTLNNPDHKAPEELVGYKHTGDGNTCTRVDAVEGLLEVKTHALLENERTGVDAC